MVKRKFELLSPSHYLLGTQKQLIMDISSYYFWVLPDARALVLAEVKGERQKNIRILTGSARIQF